MVIGGAAWVSFISLFNVQVLSQAPDWVRARVLAVSMLVFQGAVAAGSATWGAVAAHVGAKQGAALGWHGSNLVNGAGIVSAPFGCKRGFDALEPLAHPCGWCQRRFDRPDTRDR